MLTQTASRIHTRWMVRRDLPEVVQIESEAAPGPWTEQDFLSVLRQRNCIAQVAEQGGRVIGFAVYELHRDRLVLLNLAVSLRRQRQGIGRQLVDLLVGKLLPGRRQSVEVLVPEGNLVAQLFFRAIGFRATEILRDCSDQPAEDRYLFRLRLADRSPRPSCGEA